MIALKKIILAFALLAVMLCITGCDENFDEPGSGYNEAFGEPIVTLIINDSKKNAEEDIQIFDNLSERERFAYLHYYIEGEAPKYDLRIRTEICRGEDDYNIGEEFKTLSDEMVTEKSGKWQHKDLFLATEDIYFYRVTIYHGDSEKILASKTIYTPKEEQIYSEVLQDVPEYRLIGLTEEEQIFYDLCSYTVFVSVCWQIADSFTANAFAGMLLITSKVLFEQMKIYGISREKQNLEDIIQLMAIFSVPYKAVLLRLYEEGYMSPEHVNEFLKIKKEVLKKEIGYVVEADRWQNRTPEIIQLGSLKQLMDQNNENELLTDSRAASDQKAYVQLLQQYTRDRR